MLKYLSLFSGIGSPEQALKNLGVEFELFGFSEIDKYAIKSYCAVHGVDESLNLGDITKIDIESLPLDIDLITHGSPCQDFSVAGSGKGGDIGTGTRSSLMWNTVAICEHCKPKYVIWENVKNVLSKKHRHNFDKYLEEMDRIGYNNFYQILNAKDYGVPQNRERIFVVSIRKDIEKDFKFPKGFDNGIRLKDILEEEVEEKYYINTEKAEKLIQEFKSTNKKTLNINPSGKGMNGVVRNDEIASTVTTNKGEGQKVVIPCITPDRLEKRQNGRRFKEDGEPMFTLTSQDRHGVLETNTLNFIGGIGEKDIVGDNKSLSRNYPQGNRVYDSNNIACSQTANGGGIGGKTGLYLVGNLNIKGNEQIRRVYSEEGISPTLNTMQGGNCQPKVMYKVKQATKQGYDIAEEGDSINLEQPNSTTRRGRVGNKIANTLTCSCNQAVVNEYRIRKLTPLECYRLMGFDDEDFYKASALNSNSQLYKQAGNSICVNVLEEIFKNLF